MKKENNENTKQNKIIDFPNENKNNPAKKSGCYAILLVIVLAGLLIFSTIYKNSNFSSTTTVNEEPISLEESNNYDVEKYLDGFVVAKDGKITCYNTAQLSQWEFSSSKTSPEIAVNGTYALIYYSDDKEAYLTNGKKAKKIETNEKISYGYVNSNGYSVMFLDEAGLKNKITVYNKSGELIYFRDNPDRQIAYAALSDDNKSLITIELLFEDKHISSELVVTNVKNNTNISKTKFDDTIPAKCVFGAKNRLIMLFDTKMQCYNLNGKLKWEKNFENGQADIAAYNNGMFALVFSDNEISSHGNVVAFYNKKGKKTGEFFTREQITDIDVCDQNALLTNGRKLMLINSKGKVVSNSDTTYDVRETMLMNTKRAALVISGSQEIKLVALNANSVKKD